MPADRDSATATGQFGPDAYRRWRANRLGTITEGLERRLILQLACSLQGCNVLDVGCGDGALALALWESGATAVTACDIDMRMIDRAATEVCRHKAPVRLLLANAELLPFQDRSFDLVTMITVLCFVPHPQTALREIARLLKPGGRLIIGDLSPWSLWAASRRIRGWLGSAPMWKSASFRSARELRVLIETAGLRVEHVTGAIYYPRCALTARLMAPLEPRLSRLTIFGAAFIAVRATSPPHPEADISLC